LRRNDVHEYVLPVPLIMGGKTRALTLSSLFTALTVVSLFIASVWPSGQLALAAVSSLFVAAAVIENSIRAGILVFVCGALLSMLLIPDKTAPLLFTLFFGYYPIVKSLIERINQTLLQWVLKLAVFNAALSAMFFLLTEFIFDFGDYSPSFVVVCIAGSLVFALFDYGYSKLVWFYMNRVSKH
jgi:hypothetical protein